MIVTTHRGNEVLGTPFWTGYILFYFIILYFKNGISILSVFQNRYIDHIAIVFRGIDYIKVFCICRLHRHFRYDNRLYQYFYTNISVISIFRIRRQIKSSFHDKYIGYIGISRLNIGYTDIYRMPYRLYRYF